MKCMFLSTELSFPLGGRWKSPKLSYGKLYWRWFSATPNGECYICCVFPRHHVVCFFFIIIYIYILWKVFWLCILEMLLSKTQSSLSSLWMCPCNMILKKLPTSSQVGEETTQLLLSLRKFSFMYQMIKVFHILNFIELWGRNSI